jgi:hypothetical protein
MRIESVAAALGAIAIATSTGSAAIAAPIMGDASSLRYFVGTWSCKTTKDPDPKQVGGSVPLPITATKSWLKVRGPGGVVNVTRDVKLGKFVAIYIGDDGSYGVQRGPGLTGKSYVFTDVMNSGGAPLGVQTVTEIDATTFSNIYTAKTPKGTIVSEMLCKKK